jgi:hypothetical protein
MAVITQEISSLKSIPKYNESLNSISITSHFLFGRWRADLTAFWRLEQEGSQQIAQF